MTNWVFNISLLLLSALDLWYSYTKLTNNIQLAGFFLAGILLGCFLMNLKLNVKNKKIGSYQRQLEKESISADESSAKVKVLEQKIEVLEKALENALKG